MDSIDASINWGQAYHEPKPDRTNVRELLPAVVRCGQPRQNAKGLYTVFNHNGIKIETKIIRDNKNDKAMRFLIIGPHGDESQNVWIPRRYLNDIGEPIKSLYWFWGSKMNQHKLRLAGYL